MCVCVCVYAYVCACVCQMASHVHSFRHIEAPKALPVWLINVGEGEVRQL